MGQPAQQLEEEIMHPVILQQLAAEHLQQMLAEADDGRRPRLAFGALVQANWRTPSPPAHSRPFI
jgi:hypothetical protein